ncbi:MAG: hypothetical protein EBS56_04160 [Planctomycetia bacterium]|nr:hypothetical protein [Planctomycetia bacterium]
MNGREHHAEARDDGGEDPLDTLEQLAAIRVPPVPAAKTFTAGVRRKLLPRLLALHVLEFACGATTWALVHMAAALSAAVQYTLTGRWPERRRERRR